MARFVIQAVAATFWKSGDVVMCSTPMMAPAIFRRDAECKSEADAMAIMDNAAAELAKAGQPYALRLHLADKRAPRGFKAWSRKATARDESFGIFA